MITFDYVCPRGSGLDNPTLTIFCLDEAVIESGVRRDRDFVPERLKRYGSTPPKVREFFYGHFRSCRRCKEFYTEAMPSARKTIDGLDAP